MRYLTSYLLLENVAQAKALLNKMGIDSKSSEDFAKINKMLSGNGYTYWFTKLLFVDKISFDELKNVWNIIKTEPQIISKFTTPVVKLENIEKFWDEYLNSKGLSNAKNAYNEFPSAQKRMVDLNNDDDILLLNDLFKDKDRNLFIKKISRYHSRKNLIDALKLFLYNKSDNEFSKLLKRLQEDNVDIKYYDDDDDIIVCTVNYQQLRKYGADTSWCIVGSEGTFNVYNQNPLSQQFIVFLLDRSDNYSKIGITTNMSGIYTAHLKNDKYIDAKEVVNLLGSKGFNTGLLFPSKETALGISWTYTPINVLQEIGFTEDEIYSKKRSDVSKLDWNSLSVYFLVGSGYKKEEIVKKKNIYGRYLNSYFNLDLGRFVQGVPPKTDLEFFTAEEIEKYKLLDKTELKVSDLKPYSKEEIIKKKLIYRVPDMQLYQLGGLGFNYNEILKLSKIDKFKLDPFSSKISGKSRDYVIRNFILTYNDPHFEKAKFIELVNLTNEDTTFNELYNSFGNRAYFNTLCQTKDQLPKVIIEYFSKIFNLTKENIGKIIRADHHGRELRYTIALSSYIIEDFYRNECIDLLKDSILMDEDPFYTYVEMGTLKSNLAEYPELYDEIFNKTKKYLIGGRYPNTYRLKITTSDHYRNDKIDIKSTLSNIDFWGAYDVMGLNGLGNVFSHVGLSTSSDIIEYCTNKGIDISGENGFEFAEKLKSINENNLLLLSFCIENSIDVDSCYDKLDEIIKSSVKKMESWEMAQIQSLLKKRDNYEKKWENLIEKNDINEAIQQTKSSSEYCWAKSREMSKPEVWYEKYWPIIKKLDFDKTKKDRREFDDVLFVSTVVLLAKVGKISELESINYDFINNGKKWSSWSGDNPLLDLAKIVADKHITNWKRTWLKLDKDQRKEIFKWLDKQVMKYVKKDGLDSIYILRQMLIAWYIFNREKLNSYIERIKKMRNNYTYIGRGDVERQKTVRLKELDKLFGYLAEEGKFEDLESILNQFKLSKIEKKNTIGSIGRSNLFYSRKEGDDLYNREAEKEHRKKYEEILKKYFEEQSPVKESYILRWNYFNI